MDTLEDLRNIPVSHPRRGRQSEILGDISSISRAPEMPEISHYNLHRIIDIYASVEGRDLGAAGNDVEAHCRRRMKRAFRAARELWCAASSIP